jgi:hypothetical protein
MANWIFLTEAVYLNFEYRFIETLFETLHSRIFIQNYCMKKIPIIAYLLFPANCINAQLLLEAGTSWKSMAGTYVVLNDLGFRHNASSTLFDNAFKFTGNGDVFIDGTTLPLFSNLEVNKTGSAKIILQRSIEIRQTLSFMSGLVELNNFSIDLSTTGQLIGEGENTRIIGANGGYIQIVNTLNAPNNVNPGNLGAIITSSQNLGSVTIKRGHKSQTNGSGGGNSILRYYDIDPTNNTGLNATLRFNYLDAELTTLDENSLVLWKSVNTQSWNEEGFTSRNTSSNWAEKTGINDLSRWTLSSPGNALPVTGMILSGRWKNNAAQLNWITLTEINNDHFDVERKYTGENDFTSVGIKNSAYTAGNSQTSTAYDWTDAAANNRGPILYRIRQTDKSGRFAFSNTIAVKPEDIKIFIEKTYPTIAVDHSIYIQTGTLNIQKINVRLYDMKGRLYFSKQLVYEPQWVQLPTLSNGAYRLVISANEHTYKTSFIKN